MFQVFSIVPEYDFRDAIVGSRALVHPYNFLTVEGARAVAALLDRDGDDVAHVVVRVGESPYSAVGGYAGYNSRRERRPAGFDMDAAMDDMPF